MGYSNDILLLMINETLNELEDCKHTLERGEKVSYVWEDKIKEIYDLIRMQKMKAVAIVIVSVVLLEIGLSAVALRVIYRDINEDEKDIQ